MKDGDLLIQQIKHRVLLQALWVLFNSPKLERDGIDWKDFFRANRN